MLGFALLANMAFWASLYVYVPVLPVHAESLDPSLGIVGVVIGAYGFSQLLLRIPIGWASDRTGSRKPFLIGGLAANALGAMVMALAPAAWVLAGGRALVGVGAATFVIWSVYLAELFPDRNIARATGIAVAMSAIGQVGIMLLGGAVAENFGVVPTFWIGTALALTGILLVAPLRESRPTTSVVKLGLHRSILHGDLVVGALLAAVLQFANFALTFSFVPIYATTLGASKADLGVLTTVTVGSSAVAAFLIAYLGNRGSARLAVGTGFGMVALGTAVIPLVDNLATLAAVQILSGFGRGLLFPMLMATSIRHARPAERATAMGVFQAVYAIGMTFGPVTAGTLADRIGLPVLFLGVGLTLGIASFAALRWPARDESPRRAVPAVM